MTREKIRSEILATAEAAAAIGVTPWTLGQWRAAGILMPVLNTGRGLVYWRGDLRRFAEDPALVARLVKRGRKKQVAKR